MLNKKGFLLIESILVMSVLLVGMILLYSNYNKIILNYGKVSYYDNVEDLYTAYYTYINKDAIGYNNENVKIIDLVNQPNKVLNNLDIEKIYYFRKETINNIFNSTNESNDNTNLDWYDGTTINYLLSIKNKSAIDSCEEDKEPCLTVVKIKRDGYYYFAKYEAYNVKPIANKTTSKKEESSTEPTSPIDTTKPTTKPTTTKPTSFSFAKDSWKTISENVKNGYANEYNVGDTRTVTLTSGRTYTLRLANNTTPSECSSSDFSQTACGFVVEFMDIDDKDIQRMNSTGTNLGGWPATNIRTYINSDFYNKLPSDLQDVIISTKVISGHGLLYNSNFTSIDKLYFFSEKEIWNTSTYDSAANNTRQLDYYASKGVTGTNITNAIKKYINSNIKSSWWLRTSNLNDNTSFLYTSQDGNNYSAYAYSSNLGFSPAFRIGYQEPSFADDSWNTIAENIRIGKTDLYSVGDEKEVEINGKSYTVRVANNSTPDECNNAEFSETACGFVVEFVDIIESRVMNSSSTGINVGGWPASEMRTYANVEFFKKLPKELQDIIIDTKVISGHGRTTGETNFTSTDKIYLLSAKEVWIDGSSSPISSKDTAYNNTRQLDYYASKGVTTSSYSNVIKSTDGLEQLWWLRTAYSEDNYSFFNTYQKGIWNAGYAFRQYGFAPAFRIG